MYTIKQIPEDFVVEELFSRPLKEKGRHAVFLLRKKCRNTEDVVGFIANSLGIRRKMIGYAGIKDRKAVTSQYISIGSVSPEKASALKIENASLEFKGFLDEPITLGSHDGNRFTITVRNLDKGQGISNLEYIPNYFDEQRFSTSNVVIGKMLVKKDFRSALQKMAETNGSIKQEVDDYLANNKNNYIGAMQVVPRKIIMLYLHSYQSLIFNELLSEYLCRKRIDCRESEYSLGFFLFPKDGFHEEKKAPLVGFGMEIQDAEIKEMMDYIMKKEDIDEREFIIRELQGLSMEGSERDMFAKIESLEISGMEDDELNPGKKKVIMKFSLQKGAYATMAVRGMIA